MAAKRIVRLAAFCALTVTLAPTQGLASAFGFKAGVTKEQIVAILGSQTLTRVDGDVYIFSKAPPPASRIQEYMCAISPEKGLLKVVAISKDIETNSFGQALKDKFK